jgi:hypothetical protein
MHKRALEYEPERGCQQFSDPCAEDNDTLYLRVAIQPRWSCWLVRVAKTRVPASEVRLRKPDRDLQKHKNNCLYYSYRVLSYNTYIHQKKAHLIKYDSQMC